MSMHERCHGDHRKVMCWFIANMLQAGQSSQYSTRHYIARLVQVLVARIAHTLVLIMNTKVKAVAIP